MTNDNESGVSKATSDEMMSDADRQAQTINRQNEAEDINKMVDKGLLSSEEARDFSHEKEIEIPEALLSKPPKLSERLREHVIAKFPADSFEPENVAGTIIHGTTIRSIKSIWLGEGKQKTYEGRPLSEEGRSVFSDSVKNAKGQFRILGDFTRLDETGFQHLDRKGVRNPGFAFIPCMPVMIVLGKSPEDTTRDEQVDFREIEFLDYRDSDVEGPGNSEVKAVVLTLPENLSGKGKLKKCESCLAMIEDGGQDLKGIYYNLPYEIQSSIQDLVEAERNSFAFPQEPEKQKQLADNFLEFLTGRVKEYSKSYHFADLQKKAEIEKARFEESFQKGDYDSMTTSEYFKGFLWSSIEGKLLSKELLNGLLTQMIEKTRKLIKKANGNDLVNVDNRSMNLTIEQEANYIAHCMVQGLDKSKIVPIYDWDGNLLWPKDSDTNDSPESDNEEE